jgi:hypothetical protein
VYLLKGALDLALANDCWEYVPSRREGLTTRPVSLRHKGQRMTQEGWNDYQGTIAFLGFRAQGMICFIGFYRVTLQANAFTTLTLAS